MKVYDRIAPRVGRRYVVNRDSVEDARRIREKFYDKPPSREIEVPWQWPKTMREVGTCEAVMYTSDKWQKSKQYIDYKHVAEGPQRLYVRPGFIRDYSNPGSQLSVCGPSVQLADMPNAFAVLADVLGVQSRLYVRGGRHGFELPEDPDDGYYQIDIANAKLGGAKHPRTGETFLIVYTSQGVHCVVTGDRLGIEKDGIVG